MSRVTIDDSVLTSVAGAIRDKTGTSSLISPLNFAQMIESISGGGLPDNIIIGDVTPETSLTEYTVTHDKGVVPKLALIYADDIDSDLAYLHILSFGYYSQDRVWSAMAFNTYGGGRNAIISNYGGVSEMTDVSVTFVTRGGNYAMKPSFTYHYLLMF